MNVKKSLLKLATEHQAPFYFYDGNVIENQFFNIKKAFENTSNFQVNYAIKALNTIAVLKLLKELGVFVDAVSLNEVKLALLAGFSPNEISYTPSGVSFDEIIEVHKIGAHITLDNLIQIEQFAKLNYNVGIGIRINPQIKAGAYKKITVANKNSKFGLPLDAISKLHELERNYQIRFDGFHIHLGSGIDNIASFLKSAQVLFDVAKGFKNLRFINFGGGFKVKYHEDDSFLDIQEIGAKLSVKFNEFKARYGNDNLKLIVEPGKYLVSESGTFVTEVTTIKKNTVFVNSGFNHLIRPMYYKAYHQIENISNNEESKIQYNIVGYICEQDYFGKKRQLNAPNVGDVIIIKNAGAYCNTMSSNYNSRFRPLELLSYNGETKIIRKRETFEDLIKNQVF